MLPGSRQVQPGPPAHHRHLLPSPWTLLSRSLPDAPLAGWPPSCLMTGCTFSSSFCGLPLTPWQVPPGLCLPKPLAFGSIPLLTPNPPVSTPPAPTAASRPSPPRGLMAISVHCPGLLSLHTTGPAAEAIFFLRVLKGKSPRSSCRQGWFLLRPPCLAFGWWSSRRALAWSSLHMSKFLFL